jgi:putative tryptophan/tyrosine transport system substrate-binding protein
MPDLRRREVIGLLGGTAVAWPLAARGQQSGKVAQIGFLGAASASAYARQVEGFRSGLRELGYVEGSNIVIAYRWAEGNYERLPELAAELVRSNVDVIVTHGTPGTLAAKQATTTVPIVIGSIGDPVAAGAVASVAQPGGNITGSSWFGSDLEAKRVELLKEAMPRTEKVAVLLNPNNPMTRPNVQAIKTVADTMNLRLQLFHVRAPSQFEAAFELMEQEQVEAVAIQDEGMILANIGAIATLAMKRRLPSIGSKELAQTGGLMGYGVDFFALFHRAAAFVDKILRGTRPADIPIEQATKFRFVLNLRTSKALGIEVPTSILLRADEVIE